MWASLIALGLVARTIAQTQYTATAAAEVAKAKATALTLSPTSNVVGKTFDRFVTIWCENTDYSMAAGDRMLLISSCNPRFLLYGTFSLHHISQLYVTLTPPSQLCIPLNTRDHSQQLPSRHTSIAAKLHSRCRWIHTWHFQRWFPSHIIKQQNDCRSIGSQRCQLGCLR